MEKDDKTVTKETNTYNISLVGNRLMPIRNATMEFVPGTNIAKFDCPDRTIWLSPNVWGDIVVEKETNSVVIP